MEGGHSHRARAAAELVAAVEAAERVASDAGRRAATGAPRAARPLRADRELAVEDRYGHGRQEARASLTRSIAFTSFRSSTAGKSRARRSPDLDRDSRCCQGVPGPHPKWGVGFLGSTRDNGRPGGTSPSTESIGERLRRLRDERGLTQRALASRRRLARAHLADRVGLARGFREGAARPRAARSASRPTTWRHGVEPSGRDELRAAPRRRRARAAARHRPRRARALLAATRRGTASGRRGAHARARAALAGLAAARDGDQRGAIELLEAATAPPERRLRAPTPTSSSRSARCYLARRPRDGRDRALRALPRGRRRARAREPRRPRPLRDPPELRPRGRRPPRPGGGAPRGGRRGA